MNNPFRNSDRDRDQDRSRWTEQGQTGGWYDGSRDQGRPDQNWGRDRSDMRGSPYAQGQGGHAQGAAMGQSSQYDEFNRSVGGQQSGYGQSGGGRWTAQSGAGSQSSWYGQADMGSSGYDQGRSQGMDSGGWSQGGQSGSPYVQGGYGQSSQSQGSQGSSYQGSRGSQAYGSHHDFEPDYLHWREQQMQNYDRDYHDWRNEKRQKFSSDFEGWRNGRGPQVQAENSVVGDVTDGGTGSQAHAKEAHGDKPAKH
ncbi:hypothetical protein [Brevundimonas sp.]|jgi:hypothetical protein|uniref:hypothetical protein n=1 Tax=Brevundimonas sp. TaxID=1871086 RepID=UPI002E105466|nr:hypothetical protein [Brevundimonas sp.]